MASEVRAVVDTNVLIIAMLSGQGKPNRCLYHIIAQGELLASEATFEELASRVWRPKFRRYVSVESIRAYLDFIQDTSTFIDEVVPVQVCADPDDDAFLALALSGRADCLITGNLKDFPPDPYEGVRILSPDAFLQTYAV